MWHLEIREELAKKFNKIAKKDIEQAKAIANKIRQIQENPLRFKPLRAPMQGKRRVHVLKSFVLIFSADERKQTVILEAYEHHDNVYKC